MESRTSSFKSSSLMFELDGFESNSAFGLACVMTALKQTLHKSNVNKNEYFELIFELFSNLFLAGSVSVLGFCNIPELYENDDSQTGTNNSFREIMPFIAVHNDRCLIALFELFSSISVRLIRCR